MPDNDKSMAVADPAPAGEPRDDYLPSLKKAPEAVYVRPLNGAITHVMHKCWNVLLSLAARQGTEIEVYKVPLAKLVSDIRYESRNVEHLKEALRRLNATQVEWNAVRSRPTSKRRSAITSEEWGVSTMLAGAKILDNMLEYSFAPQVKDRLLDPEVYVRIDLRLQLQFTSRHSTVLYEACLRHKTTPSRRTAEWPWQQWRDLLCTQGSAYPEWKYFSRDVLKPAVKEVNTIAEDFSIEPIINKQGGRVVSLQFWIHPKQQRSLDLANEQIFAHNEELIARMVRLGIARNDAEDLCVYHEEAQIAATLLLTETRARNTKLEPLRSPGAYFKLALTQGFANQIPPEKTARRASTKNLTYAQDAGETPRAPENQTYFTRIKPIREYFAAMSDADRADLLAEFGNSLASSTDQGLFQSKGLKSAPIAGMFYKWLAERDGLSTHKR